MNEHIKELAEQALDIVANKRVLSDGQIERTWDPHAYDQVFAELIVKECIAKIEEAAEYSPELYGVALDIQDYFGIEE